MNKADFSKNFLDYYKGQGFLFFVPGEEFGDPEKMSLGTYQETARNVPTIGKATKNNLRPL